MKALQKLNFVRIKVDETDNECVAQLIKPAHQGWIVRWMPSLVVYDNDDQYEEGREFTKLDLGMGVTTDCVPKNAIIEKVKVTVGIVVDGVYNCCYMVEFNDDPEPPVLYAIEDTCAAFYSGLAKDCIADLRSGSHTP